MYLHHLIDPRPKKYTHVYMTNISALVTMIHGTIFIILTALLSIQYVAAAQKELGWEDLLPPTKDYVDPFLTLSGIQINELSIVARLRDRVKDRELTESEQTELKENEDSLIKQGVDIDGLMKARQEIIAIRTEAANATKSELNGVEIRMPGYLLPLDFNNDLVVEFLLVPFVGACIHVPPPPPNQIVHVEYEKGYKTDGLYEPVWIIGTMTAGPSTQNLFLADGSSDVPVGYSMKADKVEAYEVE